MKTPLAPLQFYHTAPDEIGNFVNPPIHELSDTQLQQWIDEKSDSFLHLIRPDLKEDYQNIRIRFKQHQKLKQDPLPSYYIYKISNTQSNYIGLICGVQCQAISEGLVLPHEETLKSREELFVRYLTEVGFNAEPVMLAHQSLPAWDELRNRLTNFSPFANFNLNNFNHKLWRIDHPTIIGQIQTIFREVGSLYIADGHHRSKSSLLLSQKPKHNHASHFLSFLIDEKQLKVDSFYRLIKDLNHLRPDHFLTALNENFEVKRTLRYRQPSKKGEFSIYLESSWYKITSKSSAFLSASHLLVDKILEPLLGIQDLRNDSRLDCQYSSTPESEIEKSVQAGRAALGIVHFPLTFEKVMDLSNKGHMLPPKSTYIEPKLPNGMLIHAW